MKIVAKLGFSADTQELSSRKLAWKASDGPQLTSSSQDDMVDLFGRLPVHERQYIQHVVAVDGVGSAYAYAAVTVYQGPVGAPSVFQHEVSCSVSIFHYYHLTF